MGSSIGYDEFMLQAIYARRKYERKLNSFIKSKMSEDELSKLIHLKEEGWISIIKEGKGYGKLSEEEFKGFYRMISFI